MSTILIIYSTKEGQTLNICHTLQAFLSQRQHRVSVVPIADAYEIDLLGFDKIVIGASVHYEHHSPLIYKFIRHRQALLDSKPNAFFSVNMVARKPEKSSAATNPYLQKFLKQISWTPKVIDVFAGKIDYPSYTAFDRTLIRLIMWLTNGPTDPTAVVEYTDWRQVALFAERIDDM